MLKLGNKINFPLEELASSVEVKLREQMPSNEYMEGKKVVFLKGDREVQPYLGWGDGGGMLKFRQLKLEGRARTLAAIDSSTVPIAETNEGCVYSVKAGLVLSRDGELSYLRFGPYLSYIGEANIEEAVEGMRREGRLARLVLISKEMAQRMLRIRVERILAFELSRNLKDSVILLDGSLRPSIFDHREEGLERILEECGKNGNSLAGLSKTTRLKLLGRLSSSLYHVEPPVYIDIGDYIYVGDGVRSLLTRFSRDGLALRLDVAEHKLGKCEEVMADIMRNDCMVRGYPSSLRIAHHLSLFTNHELIGIESFLIKEYSMRELVGNDVRSFLLGWVGGVRV